MFQSTGGTKCPVAGGGGALGQDDLTSARLYYQLETRFNRLHTICVVLLKKLPEQQKFYYFFVKVNNHPS